jgi:hypothetical protein
MNEHGKIQPNYGNGTRPLALVLIVLTAAVSVYTMIVSPPPPGPDVTAHEQRFAGVHRALPRDGTVGYVSDIDPLSGIGFLQEYYLTQYTLAPVVVDRRPEGALVIGNFSSPTGMRQALAMHALSAKYNFGDGVLLFGPKAR